MAASSVRSASNRLYLLYYPFDYFPNFQLPELQSIASYFGISLNIIHGDLLKSPFLVFNVSSEDHAKQIISKTVLAKSLFELWGQGETFAQLRKNIRLYPDQYKNPYFHKDRTIRIDCESFQKHQTQEDKLDRILIVQEEDTLPFEGSVRLKDPDTIFGLFVAYDRNGTLPSEDPTKMYFGRWLGDGQKCTVKKYNLQERKFIGNTSMNPVLSMVMANMAHIKRNSFVFDPFVGTGSLLVASAHLGAYVIGSDIDFNILHGKGRASRKGVKWRGPDDNLRSCLKQYNLDHRYIDVLQLDSSKNDTWRHQSYFDAILTDPPYGIREKTAKSPSDDLHSDGSTNNENPKPCYDMKDLFLDLLNFSAKYLVLGGRLIYWLPVVRVEYSDKHLPCHPCLKIIANCEQVLSSAISRRLITMQKIHEVENANMIASMEVNPYAQASFRDKYFKFVKHGLDASDSTETDRNTLINENLANCEIEQKGLS